MTEEQFARFVEYAESRFQQLATKNDLAPFATKDDLRAEIDGLRLEIGGLRVEMRERFEIVHDRLVALEKGQEDLHSGIAKVREQVHELSVRIEALGRETNSRLIELREEMQQRFRKVNERLTALEQRIAA